MKVDGRQLASAGRLARLVSIFLGFTSLLLLSTPAQSLEINIRGRAQLQVGVSAAGTMVRVRGTLRDKRGGGLAQREVEVHFRNFNATPNRAPLDTEPDLSSQIFTERGGVFRVHRELMAGRWGVEVRFKETPNLSGDRFSTVLQVQEAPVSLSLHTPSTIVGAGLTVPLRVQATVDGVGLPEDAEVLLDDTSVGAVTLDQFGRGTVLLNQPLDSGFHDVRAQLINPRYSATKPARETLRVSDELTIDAEIHEVVERLRRGLVVRGSVRDRLGAVENIRVSVDLFRQGGPLRAGNVSGTQSDIQSDKENESSKQDAAGSNARPHRSLKTDASGSFTAFFPSADLVDGRWAANIKATPDVGSSASYRAKPVEIDHTISRWLLNLLGALALLGGVGLLLQRFWQVIYTYWSDRKKRHATRERAERALEEVEYLEVTELEDPLPIADDVTPSKVVLAGVVWDLWKQRPVTRVELALRTPDTGEIVHTHLIEPNGDKPPGAFRIASLPKGRYQLSLNAPGFMPSRLDFRLPHDGKLSHMRLGMVAIPLKIRRLYQSLVESLQGRDLWGTLSLHEIDDALQSVLREGDAVDEGFADSSARKAFVSALKRRLRQGGATGETDASQMGGEQLMALMTAVVEETYFSGRVFDQAVWQLARRLAERIRERAQGGPS